MRKAICILIIISAALFSGCTPVGLITQVDFDKYQADLKPGITQDQVNIIVQKRIEEARSNTIGRKLPGIKIHNLDSTQLELTDIIEDKTLIVLTELRCSWGRVGLTEDLPVAMEKLKKDRLEVPVICLIIRDSIDYSEPDRFQKSLTDFRKCYSKLYIIDRPEADKLNVSANPTRLLISKKKIVEYMGIGVSSANGLYVELRKILMSD